jgi:hypothetical protein
MTMRTMHWIALALLAGCGAAPLVTPPQEDAGAGGRGGAPADAGPEAEPDARDLPDALETAEASKIE